MTKISLKQGDNFFHLRMDGHAGDNIVCAALSTIYYTLAVMLTNCHGAEIRHDEWEGNSELVCNGDSPEIQAAIKMAHLGFMQVEQTYPTNVKIK